MVRHRSFNAISMANFDESEMIHSSAYQEDPDQATRKLLRREYARLVETTEEHSAKLDSMEEMLLAVKNTLSQFANQLGKRQLEAESRQLAPSIEIPEFDASNVSDWLSKVEQSFRVCRFSDLDKLDLVAFSLEGYVLQWFSWEMSHNEFRSWDEFRRRLLLKFGAASEEKASYTEKKLVSPYQVPVSSLEPGLSFSTESLVVSEAKPSDIVSNNRIQSQSGLDCVKNKTNAYQVFDKTSPHTERLTSKTKRKLSLSLKTWMFKFKSTSTRRKSLDVKSFSVEEIAWLMRDSKEIYRCCVDKEFKAVMAGCGNKLIDRFQTSPSYALDVVNKTSKPWETHTTFTSTHVASVNSLSFAVGTADNFELCVGHGKGIMRLKLLLHSGFDGDKLTELDFHIGASNSWCGWMVFDRGKNIIFSGDIITLVFLDNVEVGSKGLAYDGCVILGMNCAGFGRGKAEMLATCQQMQRTVLFSCCCSCRNHILVAIYTEITIHTELDENLELKQLLAAVEKFSQAVIKELARRIVVEQKIDGGFLCSDVKFHLKHKWRFRLLQSFSGLILWALVNLWFSKTYEFSELLKDSSNGGAESFPILNVATAHPFLWLQRNSDNYLIVSEFENRKQLIGYKARMFKYKAPLKKGQFLHYFDKEVLIETNWAVQGIWDKDSPEVDISDAYSVLYNVLELVGRRELLIKWHDHDASETSWMFSKAFVRLYPSFKLEDKLGLQGVSIDTIQPIIRRGRRRIWSLEALMTWQLLNSKERL